MSNKSQKAQCIVQVILLGWKYEKTTGTKSNCIIIAQDLLLGLFHMSPQ